MLKYFISYSYTIFVEAGYHNVPKHTYLLLDHEITESDIEAEMDRLFSLHKAICEPVCVYKLAS